MIKKQLTATTGKYTDRNGDEKTRWLTIGHIHEHEGREYVTLDKRVNLAAINNGKNPEDDRVFVQMFDPKPRDGHPAQTNQPSNEDVPW